MSNRRRKNVVVNLHEPIDALCATKTHSMVCAAGKNLLKVFTFRDDRFELKVDLRKSRQKLNFSGSVSWSPLKENLIASTSTTGAVILWDVDTQNFFSLSHADYNYRAHRAAATKVCFHKSNENLLISGSKDGSIWLYDMRASGQPARSFYAGNDFIRDIQFGIDRSMEDLFVTGDERGSVNFWDSRNEGQPLKNLKAGLMSIYSVALNPTSESKNLIATAGRDKFIRVWDWSKSDPEICFQVETMSSIGHVVWCHPHNNWRIASTFNVTTDNNIHIWDIRRPYLPYATFTDHNQCCSDIAWPSDPHSNKFISGGKDGLLILHYMENAHRPIQYANNVALDYGSTCDEMIFAVPSQTSSWDSRKLSEPEESNFRRKQPSYLFTVQANNQLLSTSNNIVFLAKNYKLLGIDVEKLCEYNATVAEHIGEEHIAFTWRMIGLLCSETDIASNRPKLKSDYHRHSPSAQDSKKDEHRRSGGVGASSEDELERLNSINSELLRSGTIPVSVQQSMATAADFFFGESELNLEGLMSGSYEILSRNGSSMISCETKVDMSKLEDEAFDTSRFRNDRDIAHADSSDDSDEDSGPEDDPHNTSDEDKQESNGNKDNDMKIPAGIGLLPSWDPLPQLKTALEYYSDRGDVQTCASICLVIGDKITKLIPESQVELWIFSYLEIIERLNLWTTSALIIKMCYRPSVNKLSKESTFVKMYCKKCKSTSMSASPKCRKCKQNYYDCCICEQVVRIGIWVECPDCGHGGHQFHVEQWFSKFNTCPVAFCGCLCKPFVAEPNLKRDSSGTRINSS